MAGGANLWQWLEAVDMVDDVPVSPAIEKQKGVFPVSIRVRAKRTTDESAKQTVATATTLIMLLYSPIIFY